MQEFLALNQALDSLALLSPRKAQVIELRYFGGLSLEETAEILDVSIATISREQRMAEAWLNHAMGGSPDSCEASLDLLAQAASGFEAVLASG